MANSGSIATELWRSSALAFPILVLIAAYAYALVWFYKNGVTNPQVQRFFASTSPGAVLSVINSGGVYLIVLAGAAQFADNARDFGYALASATMGLALGWVLGIIISPAGKDEATE